MTIEHEANTPAKEDMERAKTAGDALPITTPIPLPDELPPVLPFPMDALPDAFRDYVQDVSTAMNCPPDFVAVPLMVAAASLVARHVRVRNQALGDWTESANLWAVIVGRPGKLKTPAMSHALGFMNRLEAKAADEYEKARTEFDEGARVRKLRETAATKEAAAALQKDARADVSAMFPEPESEPVCKRYVVTDTTYEKLGTLLAENPGGLLVVRDELSGLITHLGKEDQAPARSFYLQGWSGSSYQFDRVGRGSITIPNVRLSIIGTIQPGPLCAFRERAKRGAADDGMLERFLISWPDEGPPWREIDCLPDTAAKRKAWTVFDRLDALTAVDLRAEQDIGVDGLPDGMPYLKLTDEARIAFVEWRGELEQALQQCEVESLEAALSKFRHHIPALALMQHVVDGGVGPISFVAMARALALAEYFASNARRLHSSERSVAVRGAKTIFKKLDKDELHEPFSPRDVQVRCWSGLTEKAAVEQAIDLLVAHRWLIESDGPSGPFGGRPTTRYTRP